MNAGVSLMLAVGVSLVLSTILVRVLSAPLRRVIGALCSTGDSSDFWVSFTAIMLFIAPLLFSVLAVSPYDAGSLVGVLRTTLLSTLFGSSIALLIVGLKIAGATPRAEGSASR